MTVGLALAAAVMVAVGPQLPKAQASSPGFLVRCPYSHMAKSDPIVFPKQPGKSHLHTFLGNRSIKASSTYRSMRRARTTCGLKADTSGYWVPMLYEDGQAVRPRGSFRGTATRQIFYYRDSNLNAGTRIRAFPRNLMLIAGNSMARGVGGNPELGSEIYWGCSDNSTEKMARPPNHCDTGIMTIHIGFPNCWDGKHSRGNDTTHVRYPSGGRCSHRYSIALPRLIYRLEYPVGRTIGHIRLASGPAYTIHADFWNTWRQQRLRKLVNRCLNHDHDCGTPT
ncbi:MAG: DUF1996 domain-containing protein [Actinomycetes bacterium]